MMTRMADEIRAVSYTHLDVYKRQVIKNREGIVSIKILNVNFF